MNAIIYNQPDAEYRAAPGINISLLKHIQRSPAHLKAEREKPREATNAMLVGRYTHHGILTPDAPNDISIRPEGIDGRTKEGKAWAAANPVYISHDDAEAARSIIASVRAHPTASRAFVGGHAEVSVFADWFDSETGRTLQLKGRLDYVPPGSAITDLKTVEDARPRPFERAAAEYGWFLQATFYRSFLWNSACAALDTPSEMKQDFVFVAAEKTAPFGVKVHAVGETSHNFCIPRLRQMLQLYARCEERNEWPCYAEGVSVIGLPDWAQKIGLEE